MEALTKAEWVVLNATADGAANLEQIDQRFQQAPRTTPLSEVIEAVRSPVERGLLTARRGEGGQVPGDVTSDPSYLPLEGLVRDNTSREGGPGLSRICPQPPGWGASVLRGLEGYRRRYSARSLPAEPP